MRSINYDGDALQDREEACLCNTVEFVGAKVVTVNLDNKCEVARYEREGIFLQSKDVLIVTGREQAQAL